MTRILARTIPPRTLESVRPLLQGLHTEPAAVRRFARAALLTAARAGLAASGDLPASLRLALPEGLGDVSVHRLELVRDLLSFRLAPEHAAVRRELGLAPAEPPPPPLEDDETQPLARPAGPWLAAMRGRLGGVAAA